MFRYESNGEVKALVFDLNSKNLRLDLIVFMYISRLMFIYISRLIS